MGEGERVGGRAGESGRGRESEGGESEWERELGWGERERV